MLFLRTSFAAARHAARPTNVFRVPIWQAQRFLSADSKAMIDSAVKAHPLVLFMKGDRKTPQCGFSRAVVQILDLHGVPPEKMKTYNILEDAELRSGMKEYSDWPTFPQLYVDGEFVGGCDIVMSMHQEGELETLLEQKKVIPPVSQGEKSS
ncbi:hypothetical protein BOTBODRAFT_28619 [Botryobasidium botryosum FD-172 SS1]|uniref:Monothiol glutaredoxin-5, mitochondrial n=1 Tax=Botryobasidium botryosum (strain FD-172 SS1) TaxID=930990 RepID=A0A067N5S4_BOTB1|nr:hypothetical protein BOTBODRAFT_28619 [Botryobasidium botryosum FD-172 SS1]